MKVKAKENCLAYAIVIAVARVTNDPDYQAYRKTGKVLPKVRELLQAAGVDLSRGGGSPNYMHFSVIYHSKG